MSAKDPNPATDFIRTIITNDLAANKNDGRVHTRFPPEPNAHAHIGSAKACWLNYSLARDFGGLFEVLVDLRA